MAPRRNSNPTANASNRGNNQANGEEVWSSPNWPPRLEKAFVEILVEEMGMHDDVCATGFSDAVWDHVTEQFRKDTGVNYDKKELKKHLAILKKRYRLVKPIYNHPGAGWDWRRKMIDLDDEIWRVHFEVYPEAAPYRKYGCPLYDDLCTIFTKPLATGRYAISSAGGWRDSPFSGSRSRGSSNKRKSTQPLGSTPNKRQSAQSAGRHSANKEGSSLRPIVISPQPVGSSLSKRIQAQNTEAGNTIMEGSRSRPIIL